MIEEMEEEMRKMNMRERRARIEELSVFYLEDASGILYRVEEGYCSRD